MAIHRVDRECMPGVRPDSSPSQVMATPRKAVPSSTARTQRREKSTRARTWPCLRWAAWATVSHAGSSVLPLSLGKSRRLSIPPSGPPSSSASPIPSWSFLALPSWFPVLLSYLTTSFSCPPPPFPPSLFPLHPKLSGLTFVPISLHPAHSNYCPNPGPPSFLTLTHFLRRRRWTPAPWCPPCSVGWPTTPTCPREVESMKKQKTMRVEKRSRCRWGLGEEGMGEEVWGRKMDLDGGVNYREEWG